MQSKNPSRSLLPLLFRGYHQQQLLQRQNYCGTCCRKSSKLLLSELICNRPLYSTGKTLQRQNFSSLPSTTPTNARNSDDVSISRPTIPLHDDERIPAVTVTTNNDATSEPIQWRFREKGPIRSNNNDEDEDDDNDAIRVLFAGPHFHAALPSLQSELDRRHKKEPSETKRIPSHIRLIHAPTTKELWKEARRAHVAIPFMEAFPKDFFSPDTTPELRLVVQFGVGLEGVDVNEATAKGIAVSNVPAEGTGNAQATSEHALYLAMSLLRGFPTEDYRARFPSRSLGGLPIPRTIYRKRVTVVGYGAVGSCLAKYLSAMGAKVTVVRKTPWGRNGTAREYIEPTSNGNDIQKSDSLEEALPTTDVLFLACTLTPETMSLVDQTTIDLLPRGALVVNIARGALVDHGSMLHALQSGHIGGFASDVGIGHPTKDSEPWDPNDELSNNSNVLGPNANVLFTPHVGGYSDSSYSVMVQKIADSIEHVCVRGEAPPIWINAPLQSPIDDR